MKPFLQIRKNQVLVALLWLVAPNRHYHDLTINHSLLSSWPAEFIPEQISANIDVSDHTEREGYVANLETGNLQATSDEISTHDDATFSSGSLCTDINCERITCDLHLINPTVIPIILIRILRKYSEDESSNIQGRRPNRPRETSNYIRYGFTNSTALSNSWDDPQYFTTAFPTLFPTGLGGHLDERSAEGLLGGFWQMGFEPS